MKIRQTVKKAVALGTGALMLGATILGASAANLSDYPTAFLQDGKVNAKIVVGEKAAAIDIVGAIDIAGDLQAAAVSKQSVTTAGTGVSVTGGKTKEIAIGDTLSAFTTLDDTDITGLKDERITWNDKDIDVEEKIYVDGAEVSTSAKDADFGADVFLTTDATNSLKYEYVLDDADLNISLVTDDEPLKVEILGKAIEITDVGADEITMNVASEYYMNVGDSVEVEGKTVKLVNVGNNDNVVVDVDGVIKTVGLTSEKVNGIRVQVESAFYVDEVTQRSATLKIGDKITDTVSDDESMELFGEPSTKSDSEWVWQIDADATTDDAILTIGAYSNKRYDTDTEPVKAVGESYMFPNDYASVYIASMTAATDAEIKFAFEDGITVDKTEAGADGDGGIGEDLKALKLTADKDLFLLTVNGENETADTVYFIESNTSLVYIAYEDNDNDIRLASGVAVEPFWIDYEDTDMTITYANASSAARVNISGDITVAGTDWMILDADIAAKQFGALEADYEANVDLNTTITGIDKDEDFMTNWGVIISAVEDQLDNDEFMISIPQEQVKANVVVLGPSGSAAGGASGSVTTDKVNPVGVDFGILDKDFTYGSANAIIVGGPCVNTAAATVLDNPAVCTEGFAPGEAKLAIFESNGKVALLVAGYEGVDTLGATRAVVTEVLPAKTSAKVITTNYKTPTIQ